MRRARRFGSQRAVRCLVLAVLAVTLAIVALVETRAQPAAGEDPALLAADTALNDAMRGADRSAARRLLALQFTYTDEGGRVYSRKDFLADLKNLSAAPASNPAVKTYGSLATVWGGRKTAQGQNAFFLDIWAKQKGAWRALAMQNVVLEYDTPYPATGSVEDLETVECKNPCQTIPYRVRSPAEQDVINSFLALEKANIAHDADEWSKHVAEEFVLYRSGHTPTMRAALIERIENQKENGSAVNVGKIESVRLAVYGDAAAMIATEMVPDNSRPPYRAARVWVRRNGQWLMAISIQTDIQTP
jgi:hypothetical protein